MPQCAVFVSKDIFFWPVVKAAAAEVGCNLVIVRKLDDPKLNDLGSDDVYCCLVDLAAVDLSELLGIVASLRSKFEQLKIIGFASHVHEARLAAAEQAGFDQAISRGQFSSRVADYLRLPD